MEPTQLAAARHQLLTVTERWLLQKRGGSSRDVHAKPGEKAAWRPNRRRDVAEAIRTVQQRGKLVLSLLEDHPPDRNAPLHAVCLGRKGTFVWVRVKGSTAAVAPTVCRLFGGSGKEEQRLRQAAAAADADDVERLDRPPLPVRRLLKKLVWVPVLRPGKQAPWMAAQTVHKPKVAQAVLNAAILQADGETLVAPVESLPKQLRAARVRVLNGNNDSKVVLRFVVVLAAQCGGADAVANWFQTQEDLARRHVKPPAAEPAHCGGTATFTGEVVGNRRTAFTRGTATARGKNIVKAQLREQWREEGVAPAEIERRMQLNTMGEYLGSGGGGCLKEIPHSSPSLDERHRLSRRHGVELVPVWCGTGASSGWGGVSRCFGRRCGLASGTTI